MKIVTRPAEVQSLAGKYRSNDLIIGLVPTMGWFHEGHLSLMRQARIKADRVIVSLFINPMQFGPSEDLNSYPYDLDRDCKLAEEVGVDLLYAPEKEDMYHEHFATTVHVDGLTTGLCGSCRPGHFNGVTTVVAKLFNQTLPHFAIFGEKDFQQLAVIRKMVEDLDFPIEIIGHPIVREESGLAMSSRNTYLKDDEMAAAHSLSKGIELAKVLVNQNRDISVKQLKERVTRDISRYRECDIDYLEVVDKSTLGSCKQISENSVLVMAVKINGRIRLIDNSLLMAS